MEFFNFNSYRVRLIDQRPKQPAIQINIYNPVDEGHSFAAFVKADDDMSANLSEVYDGLVSSNVISQMLPKAEQAFATTSTE